MHAVLYCTPDDTAFLSTCQPPSNFSIHVKIIWQEVMNWFVMVLPKRVVSDPVSYKMISFLYLMKPQYPASSCSTTSGARPLNSNLPTTAPASATNIILNTLGARPLNSNLPTTAPASGTNIILNTLGYIAYCLFAATKIMLSISATLYNICNF